MFSILDILQFIINIIKVLFSPLLIFLILLTIQKKSWSLPILLVPSILYVLLIGIVKLFSLNLVDFFGSWKMVKLVIIFYCMASVILFITFIFEKISEITRDAGEVLIKIGMVGVAGIILFSIVFTSVYNLFPQSFEGYVGSTLSTQIISFFYFSIISFMSVGYGDISPANNLSRILVSIEVLFGFFTVIYGLSSLSYFRESLKKRKIW